MKRMKLTSAFLSVFIFMSAFVIPVRADNQATQYADVPQSHWAYSSIIQMTDLGIFQGTGVSSDGVPLFSPEKEMMRSEFITALTRLLYSEELAALPTGEKWYSNNYSLALRHGLLIADELDGGNLDKACTRQEMSMLLARAAYNLSGEVADEVIEVSVIPDHSSIDPYYQSFVCQTYSLGLLGGIDKAGTFSPTATLSRAQAATVIYRLIDPTTRLRDNGTTVTYTWPNGITYTGAVKDGEANGYGEMVFPNVGTYKGNFVNGRREGIGTFSWLVGDTYVGQWNHDKQNGSGTYTFADGFVIRGIWSDNQIATSSFYMEPSTAITNVGEQIYLVARVEPDMTTDSVTWSTSNDKVVAINSSSNLCVVTALKKGQATVTAKTQSGKVTSCSVTVDDKAIQIRQLSLSKGDAVLNISDELELVPTFTPANASNTSLTWSSSDRQIATVDADGTVTGRRVGTAIISAQTRSGIVATCYVTVIDPNENLWDGYWGVYRSDASGKKEDGWIYGTGNCNIDYSSMSAHIAITSTLMGDITLTETNKYTLTGTFSTGESIYYLTFTSIDDDTIILEVEEVDETYGLASSRYYILQ